MTRWPIASLFAISCLSPLTSVQGEPLKLETAWNMMCEAEQLSIASLQVEERRGEEMQANFWPNPELEIDLDNICGSRAFHQFEAAEITVSLSQPFELGGKRAAREGVASASVIEAEWERILLIKQLRRDLQRAFTTSAIWQKKSAIAEEAVKATRHAVEAITELLSHGKTTSLERHRLLIEMQKAEAEKTFIVQEWENARLELVRLWGGNPEEAKELAFSPHLLQPLPPFQAWQVDQEAFLRASAVVATAEATLELERSAVYPDLLLTAGYRHYREAREHCFLVSASLPLPVFDRNQGNIYRAQTALSRCCMEKKLAVRQANTTLAIAYNRCRAHYDRAHLQATQLIHHAEELLACMREAYERDKCSPTEFFEAERELFELRQSYLDKLLDYYNSLADLMCIGSPKPYEPSNCRESIAIP